MAQKENGLILVCINEHPKSRALLHTAARKSRETGLSWALLYVEQPDYYHLHPDAREHILKCVTRAEEMGAEIIRLQAVSVDEAITSYVRNSLQTGHQPVRHIIVGSPEKRRLLSRFRRDHAAVLSARLGSTCEVHVVPLKGDYDGRSFLGLPGGERPGAKDLCYGLVCVAITFLAAQFLTLFLPDRIFALQSQNLALLFLICVMFVGGRWGLAPALVAAAVSYGTVNYFYLSPYYEVSLNNISDVINLMLFFMAAVMIALFSSRTRAYAQAAVKREKRTQALYQLQRLTLANQTHFDALRTMHDALRHLLEMEVAFFTVPSTEEDKASNVPTVEYPPQLELDKTSRESLQRCWQDAITTGVGGPYSRGTQWRFEPMFVPQGITGVLGVQVPRNLAVDASFGRLLSALADQAASILQRIVLTRQMEDAKISEEKEKLRSLLLSSVSHDLKTPLASIIGSLSVYHSMFAKLSDEHKMTLTHTALDEAQRLDSFISNILDMTRLESGHVKFKYEWQDPAMIFRHVSKRMRNRLREREVRFTPPEPPVEVYVDGVMTEQLLQNLIDNAAKYSPPGQPVDVSMRQEKKKLAIEVRDYGKGVPEAMQKRIFDKYERLQKEDSQVAGTGLGLAISRSIVTQMGGDISVYNHPQGGAVFRVVFPRTKTLKEKEKA